jgi:RecA-family ATPase
MLRDRISALKPSLVILDSLIRVHRGEENSAQDMSQLFAVLSEMRKEFGCAFAYTHHLRKRGMLKGLNSLDQRMRGSSDITAYADSILGLERVDDRLILSQLKNRDGEFIKPLALSIEDTSEERIQLKVLAEVDEEADKRKQAREMIREALTQKRLFREELVTLAKEAGISQRTLADALKDLKDCGEIQREVEGRKSIYTLMQSVQPMQ